jgi:hypothetical protein
MHCRASRLDPGPPMMLGNTSIADGRLIVWWSGAGVPRVPSYLVRTPSLSAVSARCSLLAVVNNLLL